MVDELLVLPSLLESRKADLLNELHQLWHLADMQGVGSQFVQRQRWFSFHRCFKRRLCAIIRRLPDIGRLRDDRGASRQIMALR